LSFFTGVVGVVDMMFFLFVTELLHCKSEQDRS